MIPLDPTPSAAPAVDSPTPPARLDQGPTPPRLMATLNALPAFVEPTLAAALVMAAYRSDPAKRAASFEAVHATNLRELGAGMVQAYSVLRNGARICVVPGTNDGWREWVFTNLNIRHERGHNGTYHAGALAYWRQVAAWLATTGARPSLLIGHSLGGMVSRIGCLEAGIPCLTFASPRVVVSNEEIARQDAPAVGLARADDLICSVPPRLLGFRHLGRVILLDPTARHLGEDHRIPHYEALIGQQAPGWWPYPEIGAEQQTGVAA